MGFVCLWRKKKTFYALHILNGYQIGFEEKYVCGTVNILLFDILPQAPFNACEVMLWRTKFSECVQILNDVWIWEL